MKGLDGQAALHEIDASALKGVYIKVLATVLAFVATLTAPLAQAAQDPGLTLHDTHGGGRQLGVGARLSLTVPLGRRDADPPRPVLSFAAGPAITRSGDGVRVRDRFRVAPLTRVAVRPGYDANWSVAGQRVAQFDSSTALRDRQSRLPESERNNVSTLGKIGVAVVVVAAGVGLLILIDEINDNSE